MCSAAADEYSTVHSGSTVTTRVNMSMDFELVSVCAIAGSLVTDQLASVIHAQNGTGRNDNVTWDDEWTLVVSDWWVCRFSTKEVADGAGTTENTKTCSAMTS